MPLGSNENGIGIVEAEVPHRAAQFFHPPGRRHNRCDCLIRYRCEAQLRLDGFDDPWRGEVVRLSFVEEVPQGNITRPNQRGVAGCLSVTYTLDREEGTLERGL